MRRNHGIRRWPVRVFAVADDSMRPTLQPGDGLLTIRGGRARTGQLRVFPDPRLSSRWIVKRVGDVWGVGQSAIFEARSDNPDAPGASDSHDFGSISTADSYRVVWTARSPGTEARRSEQHDEREDPE